MNDVGIDAMLHGHPSYGCICSGACRNHLKFEFGTVITPLGGASFARHGVHDVHRAHYLNLSATIQDVIGQTLTLTERLETLQGRLSDDTLDRMEFSMFLSHWTSVHIPRLDANLVECLHLCETRQGDLSSN